MASQLKVDTITGVTTAGSISVTGEGNSTTTNLQQGLNKWYINWNASTNAVVDSFNNASLTDNGTGDFTLAYTNSMANKGYAPTGQAHMFNDAGTNNSGTKVMRQGGESIITASLRIAITISSWATLGDRVSVSWTLAGDLA